MDDDLRNYLDAKFDPLTELVKRHDVALYGNGREGLTQWSAYHDGRHEKSAKRGPWVVLAQVIGAAIGAALVVLGFKPQ